MASKHRKKCASHSSLGRCKSKPHKTGLTPKGERKEQTPGTIQDVGKPEPLRVASGNVKWRERCGEPFGHSSKAKTQYTVTPQFHCWVYIQKDSDRQNRAPVSPQRGSQHPQQLLAFTSETTGTHALPASLGFIPGRGAIG